MKQLDATEAGLRPQMPDWVICLMALAGPALITTALI